MKKAVVILSGGLDSLCLGSYLGRKYDLYGITFSYGQRASQELNAAKLVGKLLKLK
jgi:7-cyano-7-deazaguanine synthase